MVKNDSSGQKIYAKGLSTTKGTSGSGELYVSHDFIEAFKGLCDTLTIAFEDVRFVRNNTDHSDAIVAALNNVNSKLSITSIIANS